jgi:hypothetical protein
MGKIFNCDHYKQKYGVDYVHYVDEASCHKFGTNKFTEIKDLILNIKYLDGNHLGKCQNRSSAHSSKLEF